MLPEGLEAEQGFLWQVFLNQWEVCTAGQLPSLISKKTKTKQAKDPKDNPNYTPETDACAVVYLCTLLFFVFLWGKKLFFFPVVHMLVLWCPSDLMSSLSGIIQLNFSYFPIFFSVHLTHTKSKHVFSFRSHNELHIFAKTSLLIFKNQIGVATWTIPAALCPCSVWKPLF